MIRLCARCVMDATDPHITFDAEGVCNHCLEYDRRVRRRILTGPEATNRLAKLVERIRADGRSKDYDCVIGVSGGVDSSFVAYKSKELGLRPLAIHLDNGWDSELAVKNIELILNKLGIDLHTHVIDWGEFRDLQLSFLKASTPDSEIPTDHAILSSMFDAARKVGVKYILTGFNQRTESHLPRAWSQGYWDWKYIKSVHREFGTSSLRTFPHQGMFRCISNRLRFHWVDILNYLDYSKSEALTLLQDKLGWKYYGGKHYESIYTRFYQGYILPRKFGFDKRKCHLSSLVCSGEMSRDAALQELRNETYPLSLQVEDREYVVKKLGLTPEEFDRIMAQQPRRFEDYPSYERQWLFRMLKRIYLSLRAP